MGAMVELRGCGVIIEWCFTITSSKGGSGGGDGNPLEEYGPLAGRTVGLGFGRIKGLRDGALA